MENSILLHNEPPCRHLIVSHFVINEFNHVTQATRNCIGVASTYQCLASSLTFIISREVLEAEYTTLATTEKDYGTNLLKLHCQMY